MSTASILALAVWLICALLHAVGIRRVRNESRRLEAKWAEVVRFSEAAEIQARVLNECGTLLCEDCRRIMRGHYMHNAYPHIAAILNEADKA